MRHPKMVYTMRTLQTALVEGSTERTNNFLLLRLIAASLVVYGHAYPLSNVGGKTHDLIATLFRYHYAGEIGVDMFFVISGFLVASSFCRRDSVGKFVLARLVRIIPGLLVCTTLIAVLCGMLFTSANQGDYVSNPQTIKFVFGNTSLFGYFSNLPSVFTGNRVTAPAGTLWTINLEARLYLIIAIIGGCGILRNRKAANTAFVIFMMIAIWVPSYLPVIADDIADIRLSAFFLLGAFAFVNRDLIPLSGVNLALIALATLLSFGTPAYELMFGLFITYATLTVAFARKIHLGPIQDYSYGIYLYGWFIAQVVVHYWPTATPVQVLVTSLPLSWAAGFLSWNLIEKRAPGALKSRSRTRRADPAVSTDPAHPAGS